MKPHFVLAPFFLLAACTNPPPASGDELLLPESSAAATGPSPLLTGTVLDARTGKPVPGATVRAPGGLSTTTDERGRFVLRGLALGTSGELVGITEAGLTGKNRLRPLEGGPLEVVLYVR
jgi:hypothetical protein